MTVHCVRTRRLQAPGTSRPSNNVVIEFHKVIEPLVAAVDGQLAFHLVIPCLPDALFTRDALLDNITLYWLTGTGASSARLYWESFRTAFAPTVLQLPVGCSIFPKEIIPASRSWAERSYRNLVHWNELDRGGHFAAFEQPDLFVHELRRRHVALARLEVCLTPPRSERSRSRAKTWQRSWIGLMPACQ
jgi:hypothetical protein